MSKLKLSIFGIAGAIILGVIFWQGALESNTEPTQPTMITIRTVGVKTERIMVQSPDVFSEEVVINEEPIIEEIVEEEIEETPIQEDNDILTEDEIELICLITMAEAGVEPEYGKRLVIDTILNRVDHKRFPNTVYDVIYQPNQFTPMWNGMIEKCWVDEDIYNLVLEELTSRSNYDVIFFRMQKYSKWGTPLFKVGNHYFSSYD